MEWMPASYEQYKPLWDRIFEHFQKPDWYKSISFVLKNFTCYGYDIHLKNFLLFGMPIPKFGKDVAYQIEFNLGWSMSEKVRRLVEAKMPVPGTHMFGNSALKINRTTFLLIHFFKKKRFKPEYIRFEKAVLNIPYLLSKFEHVNEPTDLKSVAINKLKDIDELLSSVKFEFEIQDEVFNFPTVKLPITFLNMHTDKEYEAFTKLEFVLFSDVLTSGEFYNIGLCDPAIDKIMYEKPYFVRVSISNIGLNIRLLLSVGAVAVQCVQNNCFATADKAWIGGELNELSL